ncbi:MAG: hypothetical protein ACKOUS_04740, partial [Alphaproteobacteria bacterium]
RAAPPRTRRPPRLTDCPPAALPDPALLARAARVALLAVPALDERHAAREDRRPARVEVVLVDGRRLVAERDVARGWPEDPIEPQAVRAKFDALVEPGHGATRAREIADAIDRVEGMPDARQLGALLGAPA